jgi:hypothetical protein
MLIVDPATGAMWTLQEELPTVRLLCTSGDLNQTHGNDAHLLIISIDQLPLVVKNIFNSILTLPYPYNILCEIIVNRILKV